MFNILLLLLLIIIHFCGLRGIKHFKVCCYRKLINSKVLTVTPLHIRSHHTILSLIIFRHQHTLLCFIPSLIIYVPNNTTSTTKVTNCFHNQFMKCVEFKLTQAYGTLYPLKYLSRQLQEV